MFSNHLNMHFSLFEPPQAQEVIELFTDVFSATEGEAEGQTIGGLVSRLIATTKTQDLIGCIAMEKSVIVGCIFFSRFIVPNGQLAFILSPVAIATHAQRQGVGQQLISYGLEHLKTENVSLVFTYGDPAYYAKTGFEAISESIIKAPFKLSQPIGWLAQSLDGQPIKAMRGSAKCVEALNDPGYW